MKTLKQITKNEYDKFTALFKVACEKRDLYKKKHNWNKLSLDDKVKLAKKYNKYFEAAFTAEKKYIDSIKKIIAS